MKAITIESYMHKLCAEESNYKNIDSIILAIAKAAIEIQKMICPAIHTHVPSSNNTINIPESSVQNLNTKASDTFVEKISQCNNVIAIGCEEINDMVFFGDYNDDSYIVQMTPIDRFTNVDTAIETGSIFGIWKNGHPTLDLHFGREQIAALYIIYGSCTMLVMALNNCVQGFTLNPANEQFELSNHNIHLPEESSYYIMNEGHNNHLDTATQNAVVDLQKTLSLRYAGSLVADFHLILLMGGIFLSPKDSNHPNGKLRLMYEANPLSFIIEQAGGSASSGRQRILDISPTQLQQLTPLIIGNKKLVNQTLRLLKETD